MAKALTFHVIRPKVLAICGSTRRINRPYIMANQSMIGSSAELIPHDLSLFDVISQPIGVRELAISQFRQIMDDSSSFTKIDDKTFSTDLSQSELFQKLSPTAAALSCMHGESVGVKSYKQIQLRLTDESKQEVSWKHVNIKTLMCTVNYQMINSIEFIPTQNEYVFDTLLSNTDISEFISEIIR